jgi:plastin-1
LCVADQEKQDNAKYVIGCARKMGCTVFLLWEDIVEQKPKMLLTFLAAVMQVRVLD